jgi:hypothetical protein
MRRWHGASVNARAEGDNYESPRTTSRASVIERGPPPAALNESLPDVHIPMTFVHAGSRQMPVSANADTAARLPPPPTSWWSTTPGASRGFNNPARCATFWTSWSPRPGETTLPQSEGPISQPEGLISVLNNRAEPFSDRHDAATDLGEFDDADALACLQVVLSDPSEDPDPVDV